MCQLFSLINYLQNNNNVSRSLKILFLAPCATIINNYKLHMYGALKMGYYIPSHLSHASSSMYNTYMLLQLSKWSLPQFSSNISHNSSSKKPQYFPLLLSCLYPLPMGCDSLHLTRSSRYHHPISWIHVHEPILEERVNMGSPLQGLQISTKIHSPENHISINHMINIRYKNIWYMI